MRNIKEFTSAEKRKLVMGKDSWSNETFGGELYRFRLSDATLGLRTPKDPDDESQGTRESIAYPSAQMLCHTWNPALSAKMGAAVANDCIEYGVDVVLGPGINIKRLPICGRNFEYFSEDPFLAGNLAKAYIEGMQAQHVGACVKHFCANNLEYARLFCSSEVDERTLRELYLRTFEIAVEAKPWTAMCSYNLVNGTLMSENKKLFTVLRDEFGFDGLIMSDWGAVRRTAVSVNNGLDLEMSHNDARAAQFEEDAKNGLVDEEALTTAAGRVLALSEKCRAEKALRKQTMTREEREDVALAIAEEAIVLLKNKNHALPLTNEKLVVTGAPERKFYIGGGSARVIPTKPYVRLGHALAELGFDTCYRETVRENVGGEVCMNGSIISAREELEQRDAAIVEVGNPSTVETESSDREIIRLSREEEALIHYLARVGKKVVVVVYAGSAVDMSAWADEVDAIVWAGFGGQRGNEALAKVLAGKVNPSGKLTETFPIHLEDVPAANALLDPERAHYEEGLHVGYRHFETENVPVLFPFGYGLSYSTFVYDALTVQETEDAFIASFDVKNTSAVAGKETAQLYVSRLADEEGRPCRELKGFTKVEVGAGETVRASIRLAKRELRYFSLRTNAWEPCHGTLTIQIGKNCHDICLQKEIRV